MKLALVIMISGVLISKRTGDGTGEGQNQKEETNTTIQLCTHILLYVCVLVSSSLYESDKWGSSWL